MRWATAVGTMAASWTDYGAEDNSTVIYGTKGVLRMYDDPKYSLIFEPVEGKVKRYKLDELTSNEDQNAGKAANTGVIDAFVSAVLDNIHPVIDGAEAFDRLGEVWQIDASISTLFYVPGQGQSGLQAAQANHLREASPDAVAWLRQFSHPNH